jgi:hypothetical protein
MAKYEYKTVNTRTKAGLEAAEKLKANGWEQAFVGSESATFQKKKMAVTANNDQKLYVIPAGGGGYSCLGFEVCHNRATALAREMGEPLPSGKPGSLTLYEQYQSLLAKAAAKNKATGWRSQSELDPQLIGLEGQYVEVVNKLGETERFWVGKSTGYVPTHLAIKRRGSSGGMPVFGPVKAVRVLAPPRLSR